MKNQLEGLTQEAKVAKGDDAEKGGKHFVFIKLIHFYIKYQNPLGNHLLIDNFSKMDNVLSNNATLFLKRKCT